MRDDDFIELEPADTGRLLDMSEREQHAKNVAHIRDYRRKRADLTEFHAVSADGSVIARTRPLSPMVLRAIARHRETMLRDVKADRDRHRAESSLRGYVNRRTLPEDGGRPPEAA